MRSPSACDGLDGVWMVFAITVSPVFDEGICDEGMLLVVGGALGVIRCAWWMRGLACEILLCQPVRFFVSGCFRCASYSV